MKIISKILIALIILILVAFGFWKFIYSPKNVSENSTITEQKDYKNISYIIDGKSVQLTNEVSEVEAAPGSAAKIITKYFGNVAVGDLNDDGINDAAFLLTQDGGGSGTFYYVVVALKTSDGYVGTNGILLGDRIAPQTTEIRNGYLLVNYADRKESEPMTAKPSMGKTKYLVVENNELVETPIFIETPVKGALTVGALAEAVEISSPLTVSGVAKGPWFFEASFPVILTDWDGRIIAQVPVQAQGEWMTTDYVRFSGEIKFTKPENPTNQDYAKRGFLIFKKNNPSGLPEHDDSREIPVVFK
jgi:hypothetical protein